MGNGHFPFLRAIVQDQRRGMVAVVECRREANGRERLPRFAFQLKKQRLLGPDHLAASRRHRHCNRFLTQGLSPPAAFGCSPAALPLGCPSGFDEQPAKRNTIAVA